VILTDSVQWDIFYFDFSRMYIWRGEAQQSDDYRCSPLTRVLLMPHSEEFDDFLIYLKMGRHFFLNNLLTMKVVETAFEIFVSSYAHALVALV